MNNLGKKIGAFEIWGYRDYRASDFGPIASIQLPKQNDFEEAIMPQVEVYGKDELKPLFEGDFAFMPRMGETISKDVGGYFAYYTVVEIWHREEGETGTFRACVRVEIDD